MKRCLGPVSGMHQARAEARLATLPNVARDTHGPHCGLPAGRLTAVGDTPTSAKAMYQKAERILLEEARESLAERPLPA
jgi:hypothetical protein